METLLKGGTVWSPGGMTRRDVLIRDGVIAGIIPDTERPEGLSASAQVLDAGGLTLIPGLADVHVHLREPGYSYKETVAAGTEAALAGGFTTVCPMPNLNPVPDSLATLGRQLEIISRDARCEVIPFASITRGRMGAELVDYETLAPYVAGFSDDGSGVQGEDTMRAAMAAIARTGKVLAAHCEVNSLLRGGYIHDGDYARAHGHRGICSESEWREVERDIRLAAETGCRLHICHVSTRESVALVRGAKAAGLPVTCETGAHYLAFCDEDLQEEGRFKMNPPLRSRADREALLEGCADGTIDCIASDHAPHSAEEKSRGLEKSAMGVTGLEVSLPAVYTYAVLPGHISFSRMVEMMALAPRRIFGLKGGLATGHRADIALVDFNREFTLDSTQLRSKGHSTPFDGTRLKGTVDHTVCAGNIYSFRK